MASTDVSIERDRWVVPEWLRGAPALVMAAGAVVLLAWGLARTRLNLVVDIDGHRYGFHTQAVTVGAALKQAGIELTLEDWVSPGLDAPLRPGTVVGLRRAQSMALIDGTSTHFLRTHATTVGELLAEARVKAGPGDGIWLNGQMVEALTPLGGSSSKALLAAPQGRGGPKMAPAQVTEVALRRATTLVLDDAGIKTLLHSTAPTVGQALEAHGVALLAADRVTPDVQAPVTGGMTVIVERSLPIRIEVDGRTLRTRSRAKTVGGVLGEEGIALIGQDRVVPGLSAALQPELTIRIKRVREELSVEFEPIPFHTVWVGDPELEIDSRRVMTEGLTGVTKRRYRIQLVDEHPVESVLEDVWTEQAPVTRTLAYGTKIVVRTLNTPAGPVEYWRKIRVYTTSYMPSSCGKAKSDPHYGYTALGIKLVKGIVAVDPTVIPLRSRLYIPGYGIGLAADTGGGVIGKFVDLGYEDSNYQSWHWWTDVYLLAPVPPRSKILWTLPQWPKFPDWRR